MYVAIILLNLGFQLASVMGIVAARRRIDVEIAKIILMVRVDQFSQEFQLVKRSTSY